MAHAFVQAQNWFNSIATLAMMTYKLTFLIIFILQTQAWVKVCLRPSKEAIFSSSLGVTNQNFVVDESLDRVELVKAGLCTAVTGVIASIPPNALIGFRTGYTSDWFFHIQMGFLTYGVFGMMYHRLYPSSGRSVWIPAGAFALTQTLSSIAAPDGIRPSLMLAAGLLFLLNLFPYATAAIALEQSFSRGLISRPLSN